MSAINLQNALMRPAVLQILRAAGFHNTSGTVLDVMTDLTIRYLVMLGCSTAHHAFNNHNDYVPTIQDVRMALLEVGALRPQMNVLEERAKGSVTIDGQSVPFEDMRGVEAFIAWAAGPANREIRRIAGHTSAAGEALEVGVLEPNEDYVAALKKRYNTTGEDSRYEGTLLGKEADQQSIAILGGPAGSIHEWDNRLRSRTASPQSFSPSASSLSSALMTPNDGVFSNV